MKRGLSYIVMAVFCGLCFSSCAKDELAAKAGGDGRAPVRLALSLSGNSSRTVDAPTADGNWDFTTPEQGTIVEGDVYVLVIDAVTQRLKYLVEDLRVINDYADQKILEGTMQRTIGNEQVRLVVLANLNQNQIQGVSEGMQAVPTPPPRMTSTRFRQGSTLWIFVSKLLQTARSSAVSSMRPLKN